MNTRWTPERVDELRRYVNANQLFMSEIAEKMGLKTVAVRHKCRQLGIRPRPPGRFAEWNRKHVHLREPVMRFFLTHTYEETGKHFNLSASELKSLFAYGYRDPKLKHLRKETRRHDAWTAKELVFLAQHAGVQPRKWIAKRLKRGGVHAAKEALSRMKVGCRYLNGMPWSWAQELFDWEAAGPLVIDMKAGPRGKSGHHGRAISRYRLIPWTDCERLLELGLTRPILGKGKCSGWRRAKAPRVQISEDVESCIRALAQFQRWIHGKRSPVGVRSQIQTALRKR